MRFFITTLLTTATLFSANLTFSGGSIQAQTSILGDSDINPSSSKIISHLTMLKGDVTTLKGSVDISLIDLKSNNEDRDEHMHETINVEKYTKTTYTINSVIKNSEGTYNVLGVLSLHGISKELALLGEVSVDDKKVNIKAKTSFKMSDFGIEPPSMLFLTVRDRLDMTIDTIYTIEP